MATKKAPGKAHRKGISLLELNQIFPTEQAATEWFEKVLWPTERCCGHCGSVKTSEVPNQKPMPYWCKDCRSYFSVRTGTTLENSRLPLRKWAIAVYLYVTHLKSVSSMKLHRDLKITQKSAWFMLHRLRQAGDSSGLEPFCGPSEADESYFGGRRRNMRNSRRKQLEGRGASGKTAVVAIKDRPTNQVRAQVVQDTSGTTLRKFVTDNVQPGGEVFTDDALAYNGLENHRSVRHSVGEYVRGQVHTNGVESFWSMLKRAHKGTFHRLSPKHLQRYINEFAAKHNARNLDTMEQMQIVVAGLVGRNLLCEELIADNGLPSLSRS